MLWVWLSLCFHFWWFVTRILLSFRSIERRLSVSFLAFDQWQLTIALWFLFSSSFWLCDSKRKREFVKGIAILFFLVTRRVLFDVWHLPKTPGGCTCCELLSFDFIREWVTDVLVCFSISLPCKFVSHFQKEYLENYGTGQPKLVIPFVLSAFPVSTPFFWCVCVCVSFVVGCFPWKMSEWRESFFLFKFRFESFFFFLSVGQEFLLYSDECFSLSPFNWKPNDKRLSSLLLLFLSCV